MDRNKIRKRKFNNKHSNRENNSSISKLQHLFRNVSHTFISSKVISCSLIFLSVILFTKFYTNSDNTFVPFDGTSFPTNALLGGRFWSSLLSGHYFGLRAAEPNSPIISLMWFRNEVKDGLPIRHWCNHDDKLSRFFWNYNDLEFGDQSIVDRNLQINTSFIKYKQRGIKARIRIADVSKQTNSLNSIILYSATESNHDTIEVLNLDIFPKNPDFSIKTTSQTSGNYTVHFRVVLGTPVSRSYLNTNSTLDQLKETILKNLYAFKDSNKSKTIYMIGNTDVRVSNYKNNFIAYQIVFQNFIEIEIEMLFEYQSFSNEQHNFEIDLNERKVHFDYLFDQKFSLRNKNISNELAKFAREVLSNTIGGISYFYGSSLVKSKNAPIGKPYGPIQLLTAVPSRSFFPRGFLWDEGFHQLLISAWDPQLSVIIIKSWFSLMNKDGWIPREIILGDEAKARVPQEYLVQHSTTANPPSFFLAIESLLDMGQFDTEWLLEIYPRLKHWYDWFNNTQVGNFPTTFRWRGRNATTNIELNPKTMASGFDDYPRATHPTDEEIHLDLRCWMALASRVMAKITKILDIKNSAYRNFYHLLKDNNRLEQLHWSSKYNMFCDKGLNSEDVEFIVRIRNNKEYYERIVNQPPTYECIPHKGYVSLFPFLMNLLDPINNKLEIILKDIQDPDILWTPYGIRSISKSSFYYNRYNTKTDPPYWRGAIWININYLILKALNHYSNIEGPYQTQVKSVYADLRNNLINNVFKEYSRTNYLWEQYSDKTGKGIGTYPFTGWSGLIVRIIGEKYL